MLTTDRAQGLLERLKRHPQMRIRVESLLAVVEHEAGDGERADAAERRMIEARWRMGHEALTAWAERGVEQQTRWATEEADWRTGSKKTVLLHDPWSDQGDGTALTQRRRYRTAVWRDGGHALSESLAALAASHDGFRRGSPLCPGGGQAEGTPEH